MDTQQAIKEKERIAGEIEKMLEKFSKETGLFVSDISISSTCTLMYDVITRSHTPAYSYAASIAIKSNAGAKADDCIRDAIILSMETGRTVSVDHGFDSYTVDFNTLINTVRATQRC